MTDNRGLEIGGGMILPLDAVTEPIGILAVRRAGKSNAAVVMAEQMHKHGLHWIAIDPKGDWYGIRSSRDGKSAGLPIVIFGGRHGDVPLEPTSGQMIADLIVDRRVSCVLDVSGFESEAAKIRFLLAFGDRLFRRKDRQQEPTHVFFEEVDDYCPQKPFHEQARLVHVMARILKQGGSRGLGGTIISQRSAVVNKDLLTQVQTLFALRTTSPQDRKAIQAWVSMFGENEKVIESLPKLADGEAWVWSPNWLKVTRQFRFNRRSTYDSGSTPKVGGSKQSIATLADIDIAAIRVQMAETIERAKAEDPRELRRQIVELKKKLAVQRPVERCDHEPLIRQLTAENAEAAKNIQRLLSQIGKAVSILGADGVTIRMEKEIKAQPILMQESRADFNTRSSARPFRDEIGKAVAIPKRHIHPSTTTVNLPPGERAVLTSAIQHSGVDRKNLSVLTGYKRSSRDAYIYRLQEKGLIQVQGSTIVPTEAGVAALGGDAEPLPIGEDLIRYWMERLPEGEKKSLSVLIEAGGRDIARTKIDDETGYRRSSRDAYLSRLKARGLVEFVGAGMVRASDLLFPEGSK